MDILQAAMDVSLCRAISVTPEGSARMPLPIRAGRIGSSLAARAYRLDLRDHLIFPGLINAHEHLHVNAVPPLRTGAPFPNSYAWIEAFRAHFEAPAVIAALQVPKALRLRHGALKNLLAGTTCVVHHDPWHAALDETNFPVSLLRDYGWSYALGWPDYGPPVRQSFAATPAERPWLIHLAEGTDTTAQAELAELDRLGCLAANSVLVHGVGMREQDIDRVIACGAAVVWCPTSNRNLLGQSLDPRRLCAAGRLALGSDSRLSGARDLLDEMSGIAARGELRAEQLLGLVTSQSARILRLPSSGSLAAGASADLLIVEDRGGNERCGLVGIERSQIRAVVRHGVPRIADPDFAEWFAVAGMETVPVTLDGKPKLLARPLAEAALVALEPGLELAAAYSARDLVMEVG
ncbi:amidohydrolase family protein [Rhodanobacter ginsengiterrae]|uniref:amidohydrolase family protein n=1 Tax=Rhodanobacter ginsengiterrae TaxID=2008451 RepID=UPI003CEE8A6C